MKLLSLHIENFGKISNFDYVFKENPSVISQPNGWGKTTFACFLKAMFFGMERRGKLKMYAAERSRFAPWQGGTYGGSVIFEHNGKTYFFAGSCLVFVDFALYICAHLRREFFSVYKFVHIAFALLA